LYASKIWCFVQSSLYLNAGNSQWKANGNVTWNILFYRQHQWLVVKWKVDFIKKFCYSAAANDPFSGFTTENAFDSEFFIPRLVKVGVVHWRNHESQNTHFNMTPLGTKWTFQDISIFITANCDQWSNFCRCTAPAMWWLC